MWIRTFVKIKFPIHNLLIDIQTIENFKHYPKTVSKLIAIEPNLEMYPLINEAKLNAHQITEIEVVPGIAQDLSSIEDNSVDYVIAFHVLCTINDVDGALKEAKRILTRM